MTIDELKACRAAGDRIERLNERITRLRSAMEGLGRSMSAAGSGPAHDRMAEQLAKLAGLESERAEEVLEAEFQAREIERALAVLPGPQQKVMTLRYVDGCSWREVARRAHYDRRHCLYLHSRALGRLKNQT